MGLELQKAEAHIGKNIRHKTLGECKLIGFRVEGPNYLMLCVKTLQDKTKYWVSDYESELIDA